MQATTIRRWSFVHTWTSLICTAFLLLLAITGLPLIFHHELEHLLGEAPELREMPADTPRLDLEQLVLAAERWWLRTGLLREPQYWVAMGIVLGFARRPTTEESPDVVPAVVGMRS